MAAANNDAFFRNKNTTSVAYLVGILLFLLPFVEIKCNDMPFAENTGLGLATGTDYKVSDQMTGLSNGFGKGSSAQETKATKESGKMYALALAALILGIIGLILSRGNIRTTASPNRIVGILAAVFLIVVMFQVSSDVHEHSKSSESAPSEFSDAVKVHVSFTLWYYLCIVAFLAAAFFSHKQSTAVAAPALTPDTDRLPVNTTVESTGSQADSSQHQAPPYTNEGNQPSSGAV